MERFFTYQSPRPALILGVVLACVVVVGTVSMVRRRGVAVAGLLVGPIVVAAALQFVGKVPFGTGRTDLYLFPASLLLASATIDSIAGWRPVMSRLRPASTILAGLVVVPMLIVAVATTPDRDYPATDARSAAAFVRTQAGPSDLIVTAPELGYIYAFYVPDPIEAAAEAASLTNFTPVVGDRRVMVLPHFSAGAPRVEERVADAMLSAVGDLEPSAHLWLLEFATVNAFNPVMRGALEGTGCRVVSAHSWAGVTATKWGCQQR